MIARLFACIITAILIFTYRVDSFAITLPRQPQLRLNTAQHFGAINDIDFNKKSDLLATASSDKTVRLWSLKKSRRLDVIRPPLNDETNEGEVYAVAISEDGCQIAFGGYTGGWENGDAVYIYDRSKKRITKVISGLPDVITSLRFAPSGQTLLVGTAYGGLFAYGLESYRLVAQDADYTGDCLSIESTPQNGIITCSTDGYIRIYSQKLVLLQKKLVSSTCTPVSVKVSPDGRQFAVGYHACPQIEIYATADNRKKILASVQGTGIKEVRALTWSPESSQLYIGGLAGDGQSGIIASYSIRQKKIRPLLKHPGAINDLIMLDAQRLIFAAESQEWQLSDLSTLPPFSKKDISAMATEVLLQVSPNGDQIAFQKKTGTPQSIFFSVAQRGFTTQKGSDPTLPPIRKSSKINIELWQNSFWPRLNNAPLNIEKHEKSHAYAIAPDGKSFVIGTNWYVRCYDPKGRLLWRTPVASTARAAAITQNSKFVVVQLADETLRWLCLGDGKLALSLFSIPSENKWVVWTPSGYYDASAGAEHLIGWHVNDTSHSQARFYPIARFRERLYHPEIIGSLFLPTPKDEDVGDRDTIDDILQTAPPIIKILDHQLSSHDSSLRAVISYSLDLAENDRLEQIHVLVDGLRQKDQRGITITPGGKTTARSIEVNITRETDIIALLAQSKNGISEPAVIQMELSKQHRKSTRFENAYVLAVGVSDYSQNALDLRFAANDAMDFANFLRTQEGKLYRTINAQVLTDQQATRGHILNTLKDFSKLAAPRDVFIFLLAGHGVNLKNEYYFLPADADPGRIQMTSLAHQDIRQHVTAFDCKVVLFIDTCHSGHVFVNGFGTPNPDYVANDLASPEHGIVVYTSSTGTQVSAESDMFKNGLFTEALLEGMNGKADFTSTSFITIFKLAAYLSDRVLALSQGQQSPTFTMPRTLPDFPLAKVEID